jgi:hypothetical protein
MQRTLWGVVGLALGVFGLAGCGTYSIPRIATKGTTIMIPVPDAFGAGFGRALNETLAYEDLDPSDNPVSSTSPLDDFQRGELLFALREGPTVSSPRKTYLRVRYITRVHADEASGAALPAEVDESYINVGTPIQTGQIVAFVDIPYEIAPVGIYYVFVERWRRTARGSSYFEQVPAKLIGFNSVQLPWWSWAGVDGWGGPASSPDAGMKIRIVDQSYGSFFHDPAGGFDRWDGSYSFLDHSDDLEHLVPNLKLRIRIVDLNTLVFPAAWELTLAYPAAKFEITGATLGSLHRSGGFVSVTTAGSGEDCGGPGTAKISLIDPDRRSQWVDVVYQLRDECSRAEPGDFTQVEGTLKAYDLDGNAISPPFAYLDPQYSF